MKSKKGEMPTHNGRFYESGGVCPQTVLWEFGSLSLSLSERVYFIYRIKKVIFYFVDRTKTHYLCAINRIKAP